MLKVLTLSLFLAGSPLMLSNSFAQDVATGAVTNDMTPNETDLLEVAVQAGGYQTLLDAAVSAGLAEALATTQDITIFAPNDAAFADVADLDAVLSDKTLLTQILQVHVIPSVYLSTDIPQGATEVETLGGELLTITNESGSITLSTPSGSTATVVTPDVEGSNGVIHGIDAVLIP